MTAGVGVAILKRDRWAVLAGLAAVTCLAWAYLFYLAATMSGMEMATMPRVEPWSAVDLLLTFVMWSVMMVAMMTPSASPLILIFARLRRKAGRQPFAEVGTFLLGYLVVWVGFSAVATLGQWGLHAGALLSPAMVTTSPLLGGLILLVAGGFQFTPLKHACLAHCRTPMGFILTEWREGRRGAFLMGLKHGRYCLGCCWFLMVLLFVAGVMNLLWVAAIAVLVLVEKVAPSGEWVARGAGLLLAAWGIWILLGIGA